MADEETNLEHVEEAPAENEAQPADAPVDETHNDVPVEGTAAEEEENTSTEAEAGEPVEAERVGEPEKGAEYRAEESYRPVTEAVTEDDKNVAVDPNERTVIISDGEGHQHAIGYSAEAATNAWPIAQDAIPGEKISGEDLLTTTGTPVQPFLVRDDEDLLVTPRHLSADREIAAGVAPASEARIKALGGDFFEKLRDSVDLTVAASRGNLRANTPDLGPFQLFLHHHQIRTGSMVSEPAAAPDVMTSYANWWLTPDWLLCHIEVGDHLVYYFPRADVEDNETLTWLDRADFEPIG